MSRSCITPAALFKKKVILIIHSRGASQVALVVKNLPAKVEYLRDVGSIHRSGRSLGGRAWQPTPVKKRKVVIIIQSRIPS